MTSPFLFLVKAESQKLRRRWMPWIMLALAIGITQVPYWIVYAVDEPGFEEFLLPYSITVALGFGQGLVAILAIIWAAFVLGSEYGWGTFRTVLVRGTGRWQFLAAQFSLVAATVCIWLIAIAVATGVSSLLGGLLSGHGFATEGQWTAAGEALGKSIFAILPYIILTMFFVVLTSSAGIATGLTLGYMFIIEGAIVPLLAEFVNGFDVVADFVLGQAVAAWWGEGEGRFLNGIDDPAGPVQGFLVIVAYIVVLSAATVWLFKRRDIGGARGP